VLVRLIRVVPLLQVGAIHPALIPDIESLAATHIDDPHEPAADLLQTPALKRIAPPRPLNDVRSVGHAATLYGQGHAAKIGDDRNFAVAEVNHVPGLIWLSGEVPLLDAGSASHAHFGHISALPLRRFRIPP